MLTVASILMVTLLGHLPSIVAARRLSVIKVGTITKQRGIGGSFKDMPTSTDDERIAEFQKVEPEAGFYNTMDIYCRRRDPRFCLLCDKKGKVVGVQISYLKCDVSGVDPNLYNYSNPNFVQTNFFKIPAYSARTYFVNPDELTEEGRNSSSPDLIDGLWAVVDGRLERFDSRCQPNSPVVSDRFFMQGCVDLLGQVYCRDFHQHSECKNAFWHFLIFDEGSMVGFGHAAPGIVSPGPEVDVFNHPIKDGISQIFLRDLPNCYYDLAKYDFSPVHVFLIEDPWKIRCRKCLCHN